MKLKYGIAPLALAALFVAGCETTDYETSTASSSSSSVDSERLAQLQAQNEQLRSQNATLKSNTSASRSSIGGNADLPPAKPGECFARILVPAGYTTASEKVIENDASERVEIIPAKYQTVEERVLVSEASTRLEVIPATYKTVTETVVVEPARTELKTVPARYETRSERVLVREGYTTWKKGEGPLGGNGDNFGGAVKETRESATGEIMCLVEVPAEYRTVQKKVLVTPASTSKVTIPAKTKTVTKRIVATPATTRPVSIPAKYDTVTVRKQVTPAQEKRIPIPATYRTVTKTKKVSDEKLVWREVLCETNATPDVITKVQRALVSKGYSLEKVDGKLGPETLRQIESYQVKNNLGTGGLTMATVRSLGVL